MEAITIQRARDFLKAIFDKYYTPFINEEIDIYGNFRDNEIGV